nr:hypothetical protein [Actinopolyspora saharensis]
MSDSAREVRIERPGSLRVVPGEPTPPGPREAMVEVVRSGICGSDREVFTGGRPPSSCATRWFPGTSGRGGSWPSDPRWTRD